MKKPAPASIVTRLLFAVAVFPALCTLAFADDAEGKKACAPIFEQSFRQLHSSKLVDLCKLVGGRPALLVNTASHCGYTRQFAGLQALHQRYARRGLVVIGFSSHDFRQEASDEAAAAKICYVNFGVEFTMLAPTPVRGNAVNPVFAELARQQAAPGWNFNKYLVDAEGRVRAHFPATTEPQDTRMVTAIEALLAAP